MSVMLTPIEERELFERAEKERYNEGTVKVVTLAPFQPKSLLKLWTFIEDVCPGVTVNKKDNYWG